MLNPLLADIEDLADNVATTINIELDKITGTFHRIQLPDVAAITINFIGLVKNKAEQMFLDFTKENIANTPTVTFNPVINGLTQADLDAEDRITVSVMARDTEDEVRLDRIGGVSGGGEFFGPWTANHDAGNFALNNVSSLQITDSVGGVHGLLQGLAGTGIRLTLTSGETFQLFDNITNILEMTNAFGMDLKQHDLFGVTRLDLDGATATIEGVVNLNFFQTDHSINSLSGLMQIAVDTGDSIRFVAGGVEIARFEDIATVLSLDMKDHKIKNAQDINFDVLATFSGSGALPTIGYEASANLLHFNVPTGKQFDFVANNGSGGLGVRINPASGGTITADIVNASDLLQLGVDATVPTVVGEIRSNGTDITVFSGGAVRNLSDIGSGGSQTPWVAPIDGDGFDLTDVGSIIPRGDGSEHLGSVSNAWDDLFTDEVRFTQSGAPGNKNSILADGGGMNYLALNSGTHDFYIDGNARIRFTEDGEINWLESGRLHAIIPQALSLDIVVQNQTDSVELWTGAGRTNETLRVSDQATVWLTETDTVQAVLLQLIQNHNTPADFRTIGNIDFMAENSVSVNQIYARISASSQDVTDATEDGLLQLGVMSAGTLVSAIDMEGGTSDANGAKIAFYGGSTVARQTGVAVTASAIHAALVNLNLITA